MYTFEYFVLCVARAYHNFLLMKWKLYSNHFCFHASVLFRFIFKFMSWSLLVLLIWVRCPIEMRIYNKWPPNWVDSIGFGFGVFLPRATTHTGTINPIISIFVWWWSIYTWISGNNNDRPLKLPLLLLLLAPFVLIDYVKVIKKLSIQIRHKKFR